VLVVKYVVFMCTETIQKVMSIHTRTHAGGAHFATTDSNCENMGSDAQQLGYIATSRGGEMLRALRRCSVPLATSPGSFTSKHALDLYCDEGTNSTVLGFVR